MEAEKGEMDCVMSSVWDPAVERTFGACLFASVPLQGKPVFEILIFFSSSLLIGTVYYIFEIMNLSSQANRKHTE